MRCSQTLVLYNSIWMWGYNDVRDVQYTSLCGEFTLICCSRQADSAVLSKESTSIIPAKRPLEAIKSPNRQPCVLIVSNLAQCCSITKLSCWSVVKLAKCFSIQPSITQYFRKARRTPSPDIIPRPKSTPPRSPSTPPRACSFSVARSLSAYTTPSPPELLHNSPPPRPIVVKNADPDIKAKGMELTGYQLVSSTTARKPLP